MPIVKELFRDLLDGLERLKIELRRKQRIERMRRIQQAKCPAEPPPLVSISMGDEEAVHIEHNSDGAPMAEVFVVTEGHMGGDVASSRVDERSN